MNLKRKISGILVITMLMANNVGVSGMFNAFGSSWYTDQISDKTDYFSDDGDIFAEIFSSDERSESPKSLFGMDSTSGEISNTSSNNLASDMSCSEDLSGGEISSTSSNNLASDMSCSEYLSGGEASSASSNNLASDMSCSEDLSGCVSEQVMSDDISLDDCGNYFGNLSEFNSEEVPVVDGVTGIENYGNSCYLNALVQQLYRIKDFDEFVRKGFYLPDYEEIIKRYLRADASEKVAIERQYEDIKGWILLKNLYAIFYRLKDQSKVSRDSIDAVREILFGKEAINDQQDAHECMARIFEMLDFKASNVVTQQVLICRRGHVKKNAKASEALILNISDEKVKSVKDALSNFFDPEIVEFNCELCSSTKGTKTRQICDSLPDTLMVTLSRFTEDRTKDEKEISLDEEIDLKEFCNEEVTGSTKYRLEGMVIQIGSLSGGHYISYVLENGTWYRISDDYISKVINLTQDSTSNNAYILRYEKVSE